MLHLSPLHLFNQSTGELEFSLLESIRGHILSHLDGLEQIFGLRGRGQLCHYE